MARGAAKRDSPPVWPLFVFSATVAFLAVPIAIGSAGARLGALGGLAGMVVPFLLGVRRARLVDHGDDAAPPSFFELARESTARAGRMFVYVAGYILLVFLVWMAPASGQRKDSGLAGLVVATVASGLIIATVVDGARLQRRMGGVERQIFLQSTSLAFFVTVLGAVAYALFEVFLDAPKLSMWLLWSWGMAAWGIGSAVIAKRAT
ncbi:MAG TPA: hypothetical protein VM143_02375 [Acidimicrobiales bacterium]|nr:hypothetical protein [Acidimicrobiales bacterium]